MDIGSLARQATSGGTALGTYRGILPEVISTGAGAAASEGVGFLLGKYHDTLEKVPVPIPLVGGLLLKFGAVITDGVVARRQWRNGQMPTGSKVAAVMHGVGNAGINAFFVLDGVTRGWASNEKQLQAAPRNAALPPGAQRVDRLWGQPQHTVGYIPPAAQGQWFDESNLRHFATT